MDAQTVRHGLCSTKSLWAKEPRKCHRWTRRKLEKWSKSSQGHRSHRVFLKQQPVFTLLPSRIHRSPGPWSPSEWDSWATVLCCQTLSVNSLLQRTEPCQRKQSYSLIVCYYHKHLQHEHSQSTSSFYGVKVGVRSFSRAVLQPFLSCGYKCTQSLHNEGTPNRKKHRAASETHMTGSLGPFSIVPQSFWT